MKKVLAVVVMLLMGAGVILAASPMPDLSFLNIARSGPIAMCPIVTKVLYEQPGHEDKPAYDAAAWFKAPDDVYPFLVILMDPDTGETVWYFVDFNHDGVADKQAKTLQDLGLPDNVCEIARLVK